MEENVWSRAYKQDIVSVTEETDSLPFLTFSKSDRVLDVGCGKGFLLERLAEKLGVECVGVDTVPAKPRNFAFVKAGAQNLPFRAGIFDVVYSLGVVEHLPCTEKAIYESHRVLKAEGQALITVPNRLSLHTFLDRPVRQLLGLWRIGLEKSYSLGEFCELMAKTGYKRPRYELIPWNLQKGPIIFRIYARLDNFLAKVFRHWGFFIAVSGSK